jgi:DNA-binding MarR family transcriptional regulator
MSRVEPPALPDRSYTPLIALVFRLNKLFQQDMVEEATRRGQPEPKGSHNSVFATLDEEGGRPSEMAAQAGITRQSMGEVIRDMVRLGLVELAPDPRDRRAKVVRWTDLGRASARMGYGHILEMERRVVERLGAERFARLREDLVIVSQVLEERQEEAGRP